MTFPNVQLGVIKEGILEEGHAQRKGNVKERTPNTIVALTNVVRVRYCKFSNLNLLITVNFMHQNLSEYQWKHKIEKDDTHFDLSVVNK